jgi:hypothetical protein
MNTSTTTGWRCVEVVSESGGWVTLTTLRDWEETKAGAIDVEMLRPSGGGDLYRLRSPCGEESHWLVYTGRAMRPDSGWDEL